MELVDKLKKFIQDQQDKVEEFGSAKFEVCGDWWHGWDRDEWEHRHSIYDELRKRGYRVEATVNHGVTDVIVIKQLDLSK